MSENPYQSPQADLIPPDLRNRREKLVAWLKDRLLLVFTGVSVFTTIMVVAIVNNTAIKVAVGAIAVIVWWGVQSRLTDKS